MRVCEFAKKNQTSSVEVLKQADALGIEAYSPLTQLDTQDVSRLQDYFKQRVGADVERENAERAARSAEKMTLERSRRSAENMAERAVLEANRLRALEMEARAKGYPVQTSPLPVEHEEPAPIPAAAAPVAPAPATAPDSAAAPAASADVAPAAASEPVSPATAQTASAVAAAALKGTQKAKPARYVVDD